MNDAMKTKEGEYALYFEKYVNHTAGQDISNLLINQIDELRQYCSLKTEGWFLRPYQEGKWSPKELIGHLIDTDRVFAYRALCIARGEQENLPGFDENAYVENSDFNALSIDSLLEEFEMSRKSLRSMVINLSTEALARSGMVNGNLMTCRALLTIVPGHFIHHMGILKERY